MDFKVHQIYFKREKKAFQTGDRAERKRVQAKLMRELREGEREYRAKAEKQFQTGNLADAWNGTKTLIGEKKNRSSGSHMTAEEQFKFSTELNGLYCRFGRDDLGEDINNVVQELREKNQWMWRWKRLWDQCKRCWIIVYEIECHENSKSR